MALYVFRRSTTLKILLSLYRIFGEAQHVLVLFTVSNMCVLISKPVNSKRYSEPSLLGADNIYVKVKHRRRAHKLIIFACDELPMLHVANSPR